MRNPISISTNKTIFLLDHTILVVKPPPKTATAKTIAKVRKPMRYPIPNF